MNPDLTSAVVQEQFTKQMYQPPSAVIAPDEKEGAQLIRVLTEHDNFLGLMRQELRGEQMYITEQGKRLWVQVDKPIFVKLDKEDKPIKVKNKESGNEEYVCNDDAVNEILSILKSCGLNPISPLTTIDENEIRADLLEMESKVAVLLCIKRRSWGIDKAEYPTLVGKIKILIKDARYRAKDGIALKALRTITSRIEQSTEQQKQKTMGERIRSPFS